MAAELAALPKGNERIEPYIRSLYHTLCPQCGATIEAQAFIWDRQSMQPVSRCLNCPTCHAQDIYPASHADRENAARHSAKGLHWFRALERVAPLNDPDRERVQEAMAAYLPRSVDALFTLINRLDFLTPTRQRLAAALLLPVFDQCNTLWAYPPVQSRPKQISPPAKFCERNVWLTLEGTIHAWENILNNRPRNPEQIPIFKYPQLSPPGGITVYQGRLKDLSGELRKAATAPQREGLEFKAVYASIPRPNQAYWTLSTLWAGWLWGSEMTESFKSVLRRRRYDWSWHSAALTSAFHSLAQLTPSNTPFLGLNGEGEPGLVSAALLAGASAGLSLEGLAQRQDSRQLQIHWKCGQAQPPEAVWLPSQFQELAAKIGNQSLHRHLSQGNEPASYAQLHTVMLTQIVKSPEFRIPGELASGKMLSIIQPALQHTTSQDPALTHIGGSGRWFFHSESLESQLPATQTLPLSDRVEMDVVRFLQENPGCTLPQVDQALCLKYPGSWTPEAELIHACLTSYGDASAEAISTWKLREQDTPAARRAELLELTRLLEHMAAAAGYTDWCTPALDCGVRPAILWKKKRAAPDYLFYITASAVIIPVITQLTAYLSAHPEEQPAQKILVTAGGRSNLIQYKIEHNPVFKNAIEGQWRFLKFRSLRKLAATNTFSMISLDQLLSQDPVEKTDPQLSLF